MRILSPSTTDNDKQGDYTFEDASWRINIYAAVDSWRSYRDGNGSLTAATNPGLNPAASTFQPGNYNTQNLSQIYFTPYQPLRFSNGVNEQQVVQGLTQAQTTQNPGTNNSRKLQNASPSRRQLSQETFAIRPKTIAREFSSDRPIPSIEHSDNIDPSSEGPGLDALPRSKPSRRTVSPPPAPKATKAYLDQARLVTGHRETPQPLLVILDLNGTLIVRPNRTNPKNFRTRPGVPLLFDYLFKHHVVMIYTSVRPENAAAVVENLFTKDQRKQLAAVWGRDKLDLTKAQYMEKVQVYKKLDKVWRDKGIQAKCPDKGCIWDQTNTVLVDDSHLKALAQPHNLIHVPEFQVFNARKATKAETKAYKSQQEEILRSLIVKLEELKWQSNVSHLIMKWQTDKAQVPKVPGSGLLVDEKVDQKTVSETEIQPQLPTPRSESSDGGVELAGLTDDLNLGINLNANDNDLSVTGDTQNAAVSSSTARTAPRAKSSESPIPEDVWTNLLKGDGKDVDSGLRTPRSSSR